MEAQDVVVSARLRNLSGKNDPRLPAFLFAQLGNVRCVMPPVPRV